VLIVVLLVEGNGLGLFVADTDGESRAGGGDGQVAVAETADEIEGLARRLLLREAQGIVGDALLDRGAHLRRRTEETVRGHQPVQRLVRALEVVSLHIQAEPPRAIGEVGEHRARQELVPERLPEALDLAERLRMLRPALDVADAVAPQLLLELGLAAPGGVLTTLIGQDLAGRTEVGDRSGQRLHHQ